MKLGYTRAIRLLSFWKFSVKVGRAATLIVTGCVGFLVRARV